MKNYLPSFDYIEPLSLEEALEKLSLFGEKAKLIAGGTDLVTAMREKGLRPKYVISMKNFMNALNRVEFDNKIQGLRIGALTTLASLANSIESSDILRDRFYVLAEAATQIGSYLIRNRATIGGNLCNASPAADMAPAMMILKAEAVLLSRSAIRTVPIQDFFIGPGKTALGSNEMLKEILIPEPTGAYGCSFLKISRKMTGLAIANVATYVELDRGKLKEVRVALGAVAPTPVISRSLARELVGKEIDELNMTEICKKVEKDIKPISDVRASLEYRRKMAYVLTQRSLQVSIKRAKEREAN